MPKPLNLTPEVKAGLDAMDRSSPKVPEFDHRLLEKLGATGIHIDSDPERMTDNDPGNPESGAISLSPENQTLFETLLKPQLEATLKARNTISESLSSASSVTPEKLKEELDAWLSDEKLDYVRSQIEQYSGLEFTLVATPNVLVASHQELFETAIAFGGTPQPYETWIYDKQMVGNLYQGYSLAELSGTNPDNNNSTQFSLIPSKPNPELVSKTAEQQRDIFRDDLLTAMPDLAVPSVLEAITYWQTLRAALPPDADGNPQPLNNFDKTLIVHFDLENRPVGDGVLVPASIVFDSGRPDLSDSHALDVSLGRVSVR